MRKAGPIEPVYRLVGARLAELRSSAGLTQDQVGARLEPPVGRTVIANIETGYSRVMLHTLVQLVALFRTTLDDFVSMPKLWIAVDAGSVVSTPYCHRPKACCDAGGQMIPVEYSCDCSCHPDW